MAVNKYHGWTLTQVKGPLTFLPTEFGADLADDYVQVKVSHCGLCYSDLAMVENEWGMTRTPIICGHEVVGHVSAVEVSPLLRSAIVTALSTTQDKEAEAKKFGAHHFVATANKDEVLKTCKHSFDFILVTVPAALDWGFYLSLLRNGGTLCIVGVTAEMVIKPSADLVVRELKIVGGASCSRANYREMIDFCALHNIKPQIELMPIDKINEALDLVRKNKPRYRIVLTHPNN